MSMHVLLKKIGRADDLPRSLEQGGAELRWSACELVTKVLALARGNVRRCYRPLVTGSPVKNRS